MDALRAALANPGYPSRLEDSPPARRPGLSGRLQSLLRDLLTTGTPPAPLTAAHQEVLRTTFMEKDKTPDAAAAKLCLLWTIYYRRLHPTLTALAEALAVYVRLKTDPWRGSTPQLRRLRQKTPSRAVNARPGVPSNVQPLTSVP